MRINNPGDVSPSKAMIPSDMMNLKSMTSTYKENLKNSDYAKVDISSKIDKDSMSKPKSELNQENVKRGVLRKYKTSSLEVPPPADVPYIAIDEGQASPKLIRSTMYRVPANYTIHQSTKIPMGLIVQPIADISEGETEIAKAQCGAEGPVRCTTWGGYVNPGTVFLENGTKGRWNFCGTIFPVSDTKYWFVSDKSSLPELYCGAYEFDVWGKYVYYDVKNPVYTFIIDISAEAHTNGLFTQALQSISLTLDSLPNASNTKICIITVDEFVQCYVVPSDTSKAPTVYNCWDAVDPFLPVPTSLLMLNVVADRDKINNLLEKLPEIHKFEEAKHKIAALNLSSAFAIAYEILESWGGRILTFYSRIENWGPEINIATDALKVFNTEAEKSLFVPSSTYYNDLSIKLFMKRITVDIFWWTSHNVNLVNPAQLCTRTGGDVYYYKNFKDKYDGEKLNYEVFRVLTRNNAYDVAFRVRWSDGYSVIAYSGNFVRVNAVDFELPSIDADKTIGVMLRSEGSVPNSDRLSIQAALLYSTPDGERKIRILNLYLPLEKKFSNIF